MDRDSAPFAGLLETLELLLAQARAYERALPASNYPARAAVAALPLQSAERRDGIHRRNRLVGQMTQGSLITLVVY